jgi:hypothetical protein
MPQEYICPLRWEQWQHCFMRDNFSKFWLMQDVAQRCYVIFVAIVYTSTEYYNDCHCKIQDVCLRSVLLDTA